MYEEPSTVSKEALCATLKKRISKEVPRDTIDCSGGKLGAGQFGEVFKGEFTPISGGVPVPAAIKMCRSDAGNQELVEFLKEAAIMGQFDHPHVIQIFGYVTANNPPMIAIELADIALGDRLEKEQCTTTSLIGWAHEVSMAMCYLSKRGFIHRDLAVRNVLLVSDVAKLSDFGRSRRLKSCDDIYSAGNALVPVRWTAPEALAKGKYSSASDCWSFGIMLYEMWTRSKMPYDPAWSNTEVFEKIETGWRLPPPQHCPKAIYSLMLRSWHPDVSSRPTFLQVENDIRQARHSKAALSDCYNGEPEPLQFQYVNGDSSKAKAADQPSDQASGQQQVQYTPDADIPSRDGADSVSSPTYSVPVKDKSGNEVSTQPHEYAVPDDAISALPTKKKNRSKPGRTSAKKAVVSSDSGQAALDDPWNEGVAKKTSAKLAKQTTKWVEEWNDRKGSVTSNKVSSESSGKQRGIFRSRLKKP